jgi:hypothetical protein
LTIDRRDHHLDEHGAAVMNVHVHHGGTHTSVSFGAVPLCEMEKGGEINSWSLTTWCSICKAKFCYLGFEKLALVFSNFSNIQILVHPSKLK